MLVWEMEPYPIGDRRMPHHIFPPKMLTIEQLFQLTGVLHYKIDLDDTVAMKKRISRVRADHSVVSQDIFTMDENVIEFNQKSETMYKPVAQDESTVSLVLDGDIYYDVQLEEDAWVRMQLSRGDLIVIPKRCSFRCTTTPTNYVKIQRFVKLTQ